MNEVRHKSIVAYRHAKIHALELIQYYKDHHKPVYMSFEKNCFYDWGLQEAYERVRTSHDAPLAVLDRLLAKYDGYAHCDRDGAERFRIVVAAIDDLIDVISNS